MWWIIAGLVWLIGGYFWSRFFINHVLDDGRWSDTKKKANPLFIHFAFPLMFPIAMFFIVMDAVAYFFAGDRDNEAPVRNLYRLKS